MHNMKNRGFVTFTLDDVEFELVPSFENLDRLESVTNKPIYILANQPKLSDAIKCILACAKPKYGNMPEWFNANGVFERINREQKVFDACIALTKFCTGVLSSGSETDIKTVGADDSDAKK